MDKRSFVADTVKAWLVTNTATSSIHIIHIILIHLHKYSTVQKWIRDLLSQTQSKHGWSQIQQHPLVLTSRSSDDSSEVFRGWLLCFTRKEHVMRWQEDVECIRNTGRLSFEMHASRKCQLRRPMRSLTLQALHIVH